MIISEHYLGYPKKTLIVVTNHETARIFGAFEREVEELAVIGEAQDEEDTQEQERLSDEEMDKGRLAIYKKTNKKLKKLLKKGFEEIILCAPEVFKNELADAMGKKVTKFVVEVVPKNLASLELEQIIRILKETSGQAE